jgi:hypothetical protein
MTLQQKINPIPIDADPVHIYVDLDITNNDYEGTLQPKQVVFNEIRNTPYILQPNKYFFSVVRFELQTQTLPVFIPTIQPDPIDTNGLNYTVYEVGITFRGEQLTQKVVFLSQNNQINELPPPPTRTYQPTHPYYYCYTYQQFLNCVNTAIATCWTNIQFIVGAGDFGAPPKFWFDENSYKIHLSAKAKVDNTGNDPLWNSGTGANPVANSASLWLNEPLYNLLSGFDIVNVGRPIPNPTINPLQYRIKIYQTFDNLLTDPLAQNNAEYYLIMTSEQVDVAVWNPIKSLVFTSGLIPLLPTLTSPPKSLTSTSGTFSSFGNNSNLATQLTDFEVGFSASNTYKQTVNYNPSSEYRLLDIQSDLPLNNIQVSVFWKNLEGILVPFYLDGGQTGNIKLLFRRKDFNTIRV